ncbi:MAG: PEP-CTERM sorting domain-containing protein [Planctomycetota bacterium]|nr:PEP-CTERM sorting domain-containing protein [Planctomycetota bacterium]
MSHISGRRRQQPQAKIARAAMRRWSGLQFRLAAAGLVLGLASTQAHAAPYNWATATDGTYFNPANWTPAGPPGGFDDATLSVTGTPYTVDLRGSASLNSLTISALDATLQIAGDNVHGNATLGLGAASSNSGTINFTSIPDTRDTFLTGGGTLTNNASGTIQTLAGGGGSRYIRLALVNNGTFNVGQFTRVDAGNTITNNSGFNLAAGTTALFTGGSVLQQNAGTLNVDPTSLLRLQGANFQLNGGSIVGVVDVVSGNISFTGGTGEVVSRGSSTLTSNILTGQTLTVTGDNSFGASTLSLSGNSSNAGLLRFTSSPDVRDTFLSGPGNLTNLLGGTVSIEPGTGGNRYIRTGVTNQGLLDIKTATRFDIGNAVVNQGNLVVEAGQTATFISGATLSQTAGTINVDPTGLLLMQGTAFSLGGGNIVGRVTVVNGSLTLTGGTGELEARGSSSLDSNILAGQTVSVIGDNSAGAANLTLTNDSTNAGLLRFTSNPDVRVTFLTGVAGRTLTNLAAGTITTLPGTGGQRYIRINVANAGAFNANGDTRFDQASTTFTNTGSYTVGAGGFALFNGGGQNFSQNGGTLTTGGGFQFNNGTFELNGGNIVGEAVIIGSAIKTTGGVGTLSLRGSNSLLGDISSGSVVSVRGDNVQGQSILTLVADSTNHGTLNFTSDPDNRLTFLNGAGKLINALDGTVNFQPGAGGDRYVRTSVDNVGAYNVNTLSRSDQASTVFTNTGAYTIGAGGFAIYNGGGQTFRQNAGTLTTGGGFEFSNGTFELNGGNIAGEAVVISSNLKFTGGTGAVSARGGSSLLTNVQTGQTLTVSGDNVRGGAALALPGDVTNAGKIAFTSNPDSRVTFLNGPGNLTNLAGGLVSFEAGSGGNRYLRTSVDNQGDFVVAGNVIGDQGGTTFTTSGQFSITPGAAATLQSFNQTGGVTQVDGTLNLFNPGPITVAGGKFSGTGNVSKAVTVTGGRLDAGDGSVGELTINGNVDVIGGGMHAHLGTPGAPGNPGESNVLHILGNLALGGGSILDLTGGNGVGFYTIATYTGTLTGLFNSITAGYSVDYSVNHEIRVSGQAVPEPASMVVMLGLGGLLISRRRRQA